MKLFPFIETENLPGLWENIPSGRQVDHSKFGSVVAEIDHCFSSFRSQVVSDKTKSRVESLYSELPNSPELTFGIFDNDNHFCLPFFVGFSPNWVNCVHDINNIPTSIQQHYLEQELQNMIQMKEVFSVDLDQFKAIEFPGNGSETQTPLVFFLWKPGKTF